MSWLSSWWNNEPARDAAQRTAENNAAALTAQQAAEAKNLDFQKVLAYLQAQSGNQLNAQQLAATLSGQQQAANQFAQLYNQDMANRLPAQVTQLAQLQALTPLMQMAGMTGYQMPTQIDTTKMTAPDIIGDFNKLSQYYQQQGQQQLDPTKMLEAFNDPAAFLKKYASGNMGAAATQGTTLPDNIRASVQPSIREIPSTVVPPLSTATAVTPTYTQLQAAPLSAAAQVTETPAYKWEQEQMNKAMMNQLAAQGLTGSGAATKMASDAAMQLSQSEFDRQQKRLQDLVTMGMGYQPQANGAAAGSQLANMYSQGAQNTGQALQNAAQSRSGMYSGLGSAYGQAAQSNANSLANYYNANSANQVNLAGATGGANSQFGKLLNLGATAYGMGAGGGSSSPYGYFGAAGSWSNPTSSNIGWKSY